MNMEFNEGELRIFERSGKSGLDYLRLFVNSVEIGNYIYRKDLLNSDIYKKLDLAKSYIDKTRRSLSRLRFLDSGDGGGKYKVLKHIGRDLNTGKLNKEIEKISYKNRFK